MNALLTAAFNAQVLGGVMLIMLILGAIYYKMKPTSHARIQKNERNPYKYNRHPYNDYWD